MFQRLKFTLFKNMGLAIKKISSGSFNESLKRNKIRTESAIYKNLGDEYLKAGLIDEALKKYRQAFEIEPGFPEVSSKLGDLLREQKKFNEAADYYRAALEKSPNLAEAHYGLGVTLLERADAANAMVSFNNALGLKADFVPAHNALGFAYLVSNKPADALICFQNTICLKPDNGMALHLIASLTGSNPERAPSQYIEKLFDGFAESFDSDLQDLEYVTPQKLFTMITQFTQAVPGKWRVLDLGCGTGLVGLQISPYTSQLVGVDLSANMLEKSRVRNLYHRLEQADLTAMMKNEDASTYDLIIAADAFVYLGKLDEVVREAKRLLYPHGLFAFSVEVLEKMSGVDANQSTQLEYMLQTIPSCRYAHSSSYITKLAIDNGFKIQQLKMERLRMSCGKSVNGYLVIMESN